ncbi:hypothetical protein LINGRAHAP2_LOCUS19203 [Linum grandiflorum]
MKLWVRLEFVPEELRTPAFASGILGLIGEVVDVGVFSSPDLPGYFLRGFVRLDVLRPFFGRRKACDEETNREFWVRLRYEGLPPICFRCGRMGHNNGRCSDLVTPLDHEQRGPWISLPTGSYRRVNPFTLQPDGPAHRPRDGFAVARSSQLLEDGMPVSRLVATRPTGVPLRLPESSTRSAREALRAQTLVGEASSSRLVSARRPVLPNRPRPDKRPMVEDASPRCLPQAHSPASLGSVGSSTAARPPGFGDDEASSPLIGMLVAAAPRPILSAPLGSQLGAQASHGPLLCYVGPTVGSSSFPSRLGFFFSVLACVVIFSDAFQFFVATLSCSSCPWVSCCGRWIFGCCCRPCSHSLAS